MADITNRIGLDSLDQNILLQDSVQRFDSIFGQMQPVIGDSNDAFKGLVGTPGIGGGYNPNLTTPVQKQKTTGDPDLDAKLKEAKAINATHALLQRANPFYYKGLGETKYLPYKPIEKYLDEKYGFKPFGGQDLDVQITGNEDAYASIKNGVLSGIGKFLGRTAWGAVAKTGQGIGQLAGILSGWANPGAWYDMLVNDEDYLTASGDNVLSKAFDWLDNDLKNDWLPVYQEASSKGKGFWYRMLNDGSFWQNEISDGAAFALSAFVPTAAISKLGLGVKAINALRGTRVGTAILGAENSVLGAEGMASASNYLQKAKSAANLIDKSAVTVANTISESYFESRETYDNIYNKLIDEGVSPTVAKEQAQKASKGTFWANIPALLFSNAFETKLMFKALGLNRVDDAVAKGIRQEAAFGKYTVDAATTRFGKLLQSPIGFYAARLPEAILKEGYWEENIQQAIQRYYGDTKNSRDGIMDQITGIFTNYANQTVNATLGKDNETAISIGLGGLMGGGQTIISSAIANEYRTNKEFREKVVNNLNDLQDNWLKYGDPYERDENKNIVLEDVKKEDGTTVKQPKVSIPRVVAYTLQVNKLSEQLGLSDDVRNDLISSFTKDALFAELAIANINAGLSKSFKENLIRAKNYSEDDLARMGLEKTENFQKDIDKKVKLTEKIEKLNDSINSDILFKRLNDKTDLPFENQRRSELLRNGTIQLIATDLITDNEQLLSALEMSLNSKYSIGASDSLVKQLNSLQSQLRYAEQVKKNRSRYEISREQDEQNDIILQKLKEDKEKLLEENEELLKNIKKDEDGNYKYEVPDRERDPEYLAFKKIQNRIAQLKNSKLALNGEWYKLADINAGLEYFKTRTNERIQAQEKAIAEKIEQAQEEEKKAIDNNPFLRYKEFQKGDYAKVSALAAKIVFGERAETEEELQTQANYAQLLEELIPLYGQKVKEIRKAQLEKKIAYFEGLRDDALVKIIEAHKKVGSLEREAERILQDYKNSDTEGAKAKIKKIVKRIQNDIYTLQEYIDKNEPKIVEFDNTIEQLRQTLEGDPSVSSLLKVKENIEKERSWLANKIEETKDLIARLKRLLLNLVSVAKSLFTGFDPVTQTSRSTYDDNLSKGRFEAVEAESEILSEAIKLERLKTTLKELNEEYEALEPKLREVEQQITVFKQEFNNFTNSLRNKAIAVQQQAATAAPVYGEEEKALNKIISEEIGSGGNTNVFTPSDQDFDGEGYLRNLDIVFYSTTDPNYELGTKRTRDHQEFMNNITQLSNKEIAEKLGPNGRLETIFVTGHNINAFNLSGTVDNKYLDTSDIVDTAILSVYTIKRGDEYFFVDKNLNIIDKVGELKDENKDKVVFSTLRAGRYRDGERERYDIKNPVGATEQALQKGIGFRNRILNESKSVGPTSIISYRFALTRGIPNKSEGVVARNPVTSNLITEDQITPEVLVVATVKDNSEFETRLVNGIQERLPVGRPLLLTGNTRHAQYHYLDNNVLSKEQIDTVKQTLYNLAKEFSESIDRELTKMNGGVPMEKDSPLYFVKIGELAKRRKELGINFINLDYINFLKGILFFRALDENLPISAANDRQIWLRGDRIVLGNTGDVIYLDDPESFLNSAELDNFLSNYHHNFNSLQEDKKGKPFTEFYLKNGKLERRQWPTYAAYMLSAKYPNGEIRQNIPLTTKIKTRDQISADKTYGGNNFLYIQRSSTILGETQEKIEKKPVMPKLEAKAPEGKASVDLFNQLMAGQVKPATTPTVAQEATQAGQAQQAAPKPAVSSADLFKSLLVGEQQAPPTLNTTNPVTGKETQTTSTPPDEDAAKDIMDLGENFRVAGKGITIPEKDIVAVKKEIMKILPQFDIQILDNLIQTTLGRQAWGQFTGSAILVYNEAEEGTLYHEAFEALVNSILSDKEWSNLYNEFKSRKGTFTDRESGNIISYSTASPYQAKEELAEEFRDYKLTGKTWSGEKEKMSFFARLLKFLTDFVNNLFSIEKTFAKLDKGFYAKAPVSLKTRFSNNYRLIKDIPEVYYHKFIQGATALMFRSVFNSNKSFTSFDLNINEDVLYKDLRQTLRKQYEHYLTSAMKMPEGNSTRNALVAAYEQWIKIDSRWSDFVSDHKAFLRPFKIEFVEDDDATKEDIENKDESIKNRNDYGQDIMTIDAKKTASTSVRLLFATLINAQFKSRGKEFFVDEVTGMPITEPPVNSVFLPELANYDDTVKTAFNELSGLNNLSKIEEKLRKISGIDKVMRSSNPKEVIAGLDNKQAILVNLYNRVFGNMNVHDEETKWKMKVKTNNFLAKQNPTPEIMMVTDTGDAYFIESNSKEAFQTLRKKANAHIYGMYGKNFARITEDDKVYFQTPKVTIPDLTSRAEFTKFMTSWFNLGEEFNKAFLDTLSEPEFENIANQLRKTLNVINANNSAGKIKSLSLDGFGVEGRIKELIRFYNRKTSSENDSSFLNVNNKQTQNYVLNNYMSRILSDLNTVKTMDEFIKENPHMANTFTQDSIVLGRLFKNGKRTSEAIKLGYIEGFASPKKREGQKNSSLGYTDRLLLSFNANLRGVYYTLLPADSETEWSLDLGEFVTYSNNFEVSKKNEVLDIFKEYLKTEIRVAQEDRLSEFQALNGKYEDGTRVGDTLRIFRSILAPNKELLKDIEEGIEKNEDAVSIINRNNKKISNAIWNYINETSRKKLKLFENQGIVENEGLDYRFNLMYDVFADKIGKVKTKENGYYFTEDQIMDLMRYHTVNYFIANTEMFKLFFGDPAQYKDLTKRLKSFTSGVEWSYYEQDEANQDKGLNGYLNTQKNIAEYTNDKGEKTSVEIPLTDMFNYRFKNDMSLLVTSDLKVVDTELYNQLVDPQYKDLVKDLIKSLDAYGNINEADAQSITDIQTFREIMIKSGWRWTDLHEEQYQYEMAYARKALTKKNKYQYSSEELASIDDAILAKYPNPPALAAFTPIKPLHAGVDNDEKYAMSLVKTSIFPITYRMAEGRELEDLYLAMLKGMNDARVNIFTFESSHKVGLKVDNQAKISPLYDPNKLGSITNFKERKTPIKSLPFKHFGIQVETQGDKTGNTLGTQMTKDIKLNLFDEGVPVDFLQLSSMPKSETIADWNSRSEEDKEKASEHYRLYKEHEKALRDLKTAGYNNLLDRIGAKEIVTDSGEVTYQYKDLTKVYKIVTDEMLRRELDENTIDSVQLREDLKAFKRAPESMPSYDIMRNILWALVDKAILSPKVNGKPYIQVASTFFNEGKRKAAYWNKEENKWIDLTSQREYDAAIKAKKKITYTSSDLSFYKLIKDGKEVQAMEIMLPHIYKQAVNEARAKKNMRALSDEEIVKYLEREQPKLLEGVGFRIPTQATSSIEFFKIKGFLPETFGTAVVVPSAITSKSGSDFDVDKLNTYLNNWYLDKQGLPVYIEYIDDTTDENNLTEIYYRRYGRELAGGTPEAANLINAMMSEDEYVEKIPSLKDFIKENKGIDPVLVNSKKALENRYFEVIRKILSLPYNFQFLLAPNSNENIIANRDAILDAEGRQVKSKDINHSQFVDYEYMTQQRHYFVKGKKDIGIFAVGMTNFANSQVAGLVVAPITDVRKDNAFHLTTLNSNNFKLPFSYNIIVINETEYISLGSRFDTDEKSIMDKISGYINGAVDVAKDPIIMDMGMQSELAGVYLFLERIGVPGEMVALFMKQPIIRDYLHEVQLRTSALKNRSTFDNARQIVEFLIDKKYSTGEAYKYEETILDPADLKRMLKKAYNTKSRGMIGKDFTKKELRLQQLILANYLKASVFANHLREVVDSSNHDTANIRSNHIVSRKNWQAEDAKKGNSIKSISAVAKVQDGSSAIKDKTFVGNDVIILNKVEKLYGSQIFALQKDNPARLIKVLGRKVYNATKFKKVDEYEAAMRDLEVQVLNYLANNSNIVGIPSKVTIKNLSDRLFLNYYVVKDQPVKNPNSLHTMYKDLMTQIENTPNHPLRENLFLKLITFQEDPKSGITTFELSVKPSGSDANYTRNRIVESLRILGENENSKRFYRYLVIGSIIQNGVGFTRSSINNLIPNEDYGEQIHESLKTIDSQDFSGFEEILVRTNLDHSIVGNPDPKQIFFLDPSNAVTGVSKTQPYIKSPNVFNRNFFGKGPIPSAIFIYAGKEELNERLLSDYIVIDSIHPDYILGPEDGPYINKVSPEIFEMAKRRDFSFVRRTLFKKVGLSHGKLMYVESQTKSAGVNLMVMYKPINHWGNDNFNEVRNIYKDANGEFVGEASILRNLTKIQEFSDVELAQLIDNSGVPAVIKVTQDPTNFKNETTLRVENQNNPLSLPEATISKEEIDSVIDKFEEDCNK